MQISTKKTRLYSIVSMCVVLVLDLTVSLFFSVCEHEKIYICKVCNHMSVAFLNGIVDKRVNLTHTHPKCQIGKFFLFPSPKNCLWPWRAGYRAAALFCWAQSNAAFQTTRDNTENSDFCLQSIPGTPGQTSQKNTTHQDKLKRSINLENLVTYLIM